jgi:hypothetical protein
MIFILQGLHANTNNLAFIHKFWLQMLSKTIGQVNELWQNQFFV